MENDQLPAVITRILFCGSGSESLAFCSMIPIQHLTHSTAVSLLQKLGYEQRISYGNVNGRV